MQYRTILHLVELCDGGKRGNIKVQSSDASEIAAIPSSKYLMALMLHVFHYKYWNCFILYLKSNMRLNKIFVWLMFWLLFSFVLAGDSLFISQTIELFDCGCFMYFSFGGIIF